MRGAHSEYRVDAEVRAEPNQPILVVRPTGNIGTFKQISELPVAGAASLMNDECLSAGILHTPPSFSTTLLALEESARGRSEENLVGAMD
ncbi:unnamed protein product [Schistocephalus solidus]|uniref:Type II toxin-antitoxin system Phd/YefM family antitoxin n=1 Tax=Schistocephalus solidus TaxID=70667 RepID=A0A183SM14_SCHSO|nr:unnamed protein product [Schistocephalus solidus]